MNDLISRSAQLNSYDVRKVTEYDESGCGMTYKAVPVEAIEQAPAADAEPVRHGAWIGVEYDGYADGYPVYYLWECSECRDEHEGDEDTLTPYCHNCGAKMDAEVNSDD